MLWQPRAVTVVALGPDMEDGASLEELGEADAVGIEQLEAESPSVAEIAVASCPSSLVGIEIGMSAIASSVSKNLCMQENPETVCSLRKTLVNLLGATDMEEVLVLKEIIFRGKKHEEIRNKEL